MRKLSKSIDLGLQQSEDYIVNTLIDHIIRDANGSAGWGQFLTQSKLRIQIGFMGTAAGTAAISGAGAATRIPQAVQRTFRRYWVGSDVHSKSAQRRFAQNTKLSTYAVAAAFEGTPDDCKPLVSLCEQIKQRQVQGFGWGDWFISVHDHDPAVRPVPTAMMLIALKIADMRGMFDLPIDPSPTEDYLLSIADNDGVPEEIRHLALLAVSINPQAASISSAQRIFRRLPKSRAEFFIEYANFYELKYLAGTEEVWASEVTTFPPNIIFQCNALLHSNTVRGAYETLTGLAQFNKKIRQTQGQIQSVQSSRTHLLIYFWVGVLFQLIKGTQARPSRALSLAYSIFSPLSRNVILRKIAPTVIVLAIAAMNILSAELHWAIRSVVAFLTLSVGAALGPVALKRWTSSRTDP